MTRRGLIRACALVLLPLLLAAGWLYLYTHSHAVDTERQNQTLALLKDLKQLDSDWSADVLRSHADIDLNYDALAAAPRRFAEGLARLRDATQAVHEARLDAALARLGQTLDAKAAQVDTFKAQNSLFKNSLRYVPTAYEDIARHVAGRAGAARAAGAAAFDSRLAALVNESLRYSVSPERALGDSLRSGIDEMRAASGAYPATLREPVQNLLLHIGTLLRLRSGQSDLLRTISQVPVAARIDALAAELTRHVNAELASQFRYQRLLLAYSAFALLLVISGAGFIWHRHAGERRRLQALVDEKTRELKELATRDDLTRVHNRRHMGELLEQQRALHARGELPLCVALLDIDLFKAINDRHGHAAGDAVLLRFASVVRRSLRGVDLLGRWGGEEFLVVLPHTGLADAALTLQRVQSALAGEDFSDVGSALRVTFSAGLVQCGRGETMSAAIERADQAMYRAKSAGRNRVEATDAPPPPASARAATAATAGRGLRMAHRRSA